MDKPRESSPTSGVRKPRSRRAPKVVAPQGESGSCCEGNDDVAPQGGQGKQRPWIACRYRSWTAEIGLRLLGAYRSSTMRTRPNATGPASIAATVAPRREVSSTPSPVSRRVNPAAITHAPDSKVTSRVPPIDPPET